MHIEAAQIEPFLIFPFSFLPAYNAVVFEDLDFRDFPKLPVCDGFATMYLVDAGEDRFTGT